MATNKSATIMELLEMAFSIVSVPRLHSETQWKRLLIPHCGLEVKNVKTYMEPLARRKSVARWQQQKQGTFLGSLTRQQLLKINCEDLVCVAVISQVCDLVILL
jgi:predicted transcriptional regulator